ncbi:hypothetical protein LAZ67_3004411 [Cordylochernes scorpioides]|uniref:DUF5641 domain-containing protein n=1 Tax=Cordylochernes scorpioides TaxID=51811 RepID=A0ABY6K9F7_9ARAC|nr:hypothetical protein LAZ67_3004411 [Cordylochernes scorpioides]
MDKSKKLRTLLRSSVTKNIKEIETEFDKEYPSRDSILVVFKLLEINESQLRNANSQIRELMLDDENTTMQDLEKEQDLVEQYEKNFLRTEKKIALKVYDGTSLEWLGWWSQYEAIHENPSLSEVDKFQYLIHCMKVGTRAERLVKSYPLTEANYPKVIEALRDRFGDKVILTEVYVRQLLSWSSITEVKGEQRIAYLKDGFGESSHRRDTGHYVTGLHMAKIRENAVKRVPWCIICQGNHWIQSCPKWRLMSAPARVEALRKAHACFKCLRVGHMGTTCARTIRCAPCQGGHNSFMHRTNTVSRENQDQTERKMTSPKDPPAPIDKQEIEFTGMHVRTAIPKAPLATALIRIVNPHGNGVYGINNTKGELVKELASFTLESLTEPGWTLPMKELVVGRMTWLLPTKDLCLAIPSSWKVLPLADPQFEKCGKVDVILGADVYGRLLLPDLRLCDRIHLCAQNTRLGWAISGELPKGDKTSPHLGIREKFCIHFLGAARQLHLEFYMARDQMSEIAEILANDGTEWKFNPPGAPHFDGLWEAGIKCLKYHFRRILGETLLTYEELLTLIVQIESYYVHNLQQRHKWRMLGPEVATGSLVLIREEHVPPAKWMMGRVVEVHRGKDGLVRVVSIRTRTGILKRPLSVNSNLVVLYYLFGWALESPLGCRLGIGITIGVSPGHWNHHWGVAWPLESPLGCRLAIGITIGVSPGHWNHHWGVAWALESPLGCRLGIGITIGVSPGHWNHHWGVAWVLESPLGYRLGIGITIGVSPGYWNHHCGVAWVLESPLGYRLGIGITIGVSPGHWNHHWGVAWALESPLGYRLGIGITIGVSPGYWNHHWGVAWALESLLGCRLGIGITIGVSPGYWNHHWGVAWVLESPLGCRLGIGITIGVSPGYWNHHWGVAWVLESPLGCRLGIGITIGVSPGYWNHHWGIAWALESPLGCRLGIGITIGVSPGYWNHHWGIAWALESPLGCRLGIGITIGVSPGKLKTYTVL